MDNVIAFILLTAALSTMRSWESYGMLASVGAKAHDMTFSLIESFWFFVCVAVIYYGDLGRLELFVPFGYIAFFVSAKVMMYKIVTETRVGKTKLIYVPDYFLWLSSIYGLLMLFMSIGVFLYSFQDRNTVSVYQYVSSDRYAFVFLVVALCLLTVGIQRLHSFLGDSVTRDIRAAIQNNDQCVERFGANIRVSIREELDKESTSRVFLVVVRGSIARGVLVARMEFPERDDPHLSGGEIHFEDGSFLELDAKTNLT